MPVGDVAWHAGNSRWNLHAIGIEHEGWAGRGRYTVAEYRASAQLAAYLAHRWGVPIDRRHIIGHNEVPNPYHRGRFGGVSGHTDPGRWWNWHSYMWLVRYYAQHPVLPHFVKRMTLHDSLPPPAPRRCASNGTPHASCATAVSRAVVDRRATLRGTALWWSGLDATRRWRRHIYKVDHEVDLVDVAAPTARRVEARPPEGRAPQSCPAVDHRPRDRVARDGGGCRCSRNDAARRRQRVLQRHPT